MEGAIIRSVCKKFADGFPFCISQIELYRIFAKSPFLPTKYGHVGRES